MNLSSLDNVVHTGFFTTEAYEALCEATYFLRSEVDPAFVFCKITDVGESIIFGKHPASTVVKYLGRIKEYFMDNHITPTYTISKQRFSKIKTGYLILCKVFKYSPNGITPLSKKNLKKLQSIFPNPVKALFIKTIINNLVKTITDSNNKILKLKKDFEKEVQAIVDKYNVDIKEIMGSVDSASKTFLRSMGLDEAKHPVFLNYSYSIKSEFNHLIDLPDEASKHISTINVNIV